MIGAAILFQALFSSFQLYREQIIPLILAAIFPWAGNAVYLGGFLGYFDPTPLAFTLSGLLMMWNVLRNEFLSVVPEARGTIIERMTDGIVVLDRTGRIVDINPIAQLIASSSLKMALGSSIEKVFPNQPELLKIVEEKKKSRSRPNFPPYPRHLKCIFHCCAIN